MEKELIETHIKLLLLELEIYNEKLIDIEKHKPFIFQNKKMDKYKSEKNKIEIHIKMCNDKIKQQYELLSKI